MLLNYYNTIFIGQNVCALIYDLNDEKLMARMHGTHLTSNKTRRVWVLEFSIQ